MAREYEGSALNERDKPKPGAIGGQLKAIDGCIIDLLNCLQGLHEPTLEVLEEVLDSRVDQPVFDDLLSNLYSALAPIQEVTGRAMGEYQPTGRPAKEPLRHFLYRLYTLWTKVKGQRPKRRVTWEDHKEYSPFYKFTCAAVAPVRVKVEGIEDGTAGLESAIRRLLDSMAKTFP